MRPINITLEGFSAYRTRQSLPLHDVEFFSLSGPTGSGKSSLIDAMIFALYGRVPRLGAQAVAPVITAGADRARVALEFEVAGNAYVVSRVAERTKTGASVKEARLEKADGTSMASGAGDVTREVENLLRLRFEDFTKTVVLPQGEFARFLYAGSKERRDLLRDLLGLDIYTRMRELANERKSEAAGRASSARSQLESIDVPEEGDLEAARARLESLERLSTQIRGQLDQMQKIGSELEAEEEKLERLGDSIERLEAIAAPAHLDEMDERLVAARESEVLAEEALTAKQAAAGALEDRLRALPTREAIASARDAHQELAKLDERIAGMDIPAARERVEDAGAVVQRHESELAKARQAADAARVNHAAHTVSTTLVVGDPCPVCAQEVGSIPDIAPPPELAEVDRVVEDVSAALDTSREKLQSERARLTEVETRASELATQQEALAKRVAGSPSLDDLIEAEKELKAVEQALGEVRSGIEGLETALRRARREHEDAAEAVRSVGRALMFAREQVADLKPPHSESDDPTVQWKDFLAWRDTAAEEIAEERRLLARAREKRAEELAGLRRRLVAELEAAEVSPEEPYDVQVAREVEVARSSVDRLEEIVERSAALEKQLEEAAETEAVAGALANHLRANGFERWLMAGAITGLVAGANELLSQLSGGGYSLESDEEGSFRIIDHRNADEIREVATLSGGETFLVSLALSLSLAETLSATGGSGLDAIILDEGFGTLDEESLDVVAAVLEELAGRGLMVGVITHVKELAARAPVRYQVTREPEGSKVEEVSGES